MAVALFLLLATTCLLILVHHRWKTRRFRTLAAKLPGPPTLPLVGNALDFLGSSEDTFDRLLDLHAKYGHLVRVHTVKLVVVVTDPKDVESILGNPKIRNREPLVTSLLECLIGPSILTISGDKWKSHRRLVTPLFHFRILESYVEVFGRKASILVKNLEEVADGRTFDVFHFLGMATLDSICESVIGVDMNTQENKESVFIEAMLRGSELLHDRVARPWLMIDWIYQFTSNARETARVAKICSSFTSKVVDKKMTEYQARKKTTPGAKKFQSLTELLIAASAEDADLHLTKEEVRNEVAAIAVSGLDTSAITLSYALVLLAMHPKEQEALAVELREVFGDDDRAATAQDIADLDGVRRVIKETLRLFPTLAVLVREITEETALASGHVLPAGCAAVVLPYVTHRSKAYWPDPEAFVPDRWLPEASEKRHPYAYIPFGAGVRNCVGQKYAMLQMVSFLSNILRRFEVTTQTRMEAFKKIRVSLAIRPVIGFPIQLKKRL